MLQALGLAGGAGADPEGDDGAGDSPDTMHCAVVMLSGTSDLPVAVMALKNGAHDYLEKDHITRERLCYAVNNAIEKATLQRQLATQRRTLARQNRLLTAQVTALQQANSARVRAEQARSNSEAMTQAVMHSLTTQVALLDPDGVIIAVNDAWTRYALENGAPALDRVGVGVNYLAVCRRAAGAYTAGASEALAGIQAVLQGEKSLFTLEYPCPSPTAMHWYLLSATQLPAPTGGVIVSHMEITDRKQAEETLRLLETAVNHSNESILITRADLEEPGPTIVYVNPAFTRITGYTPEEVIGKTPRILQGPKTERAVLDRLRRQCANGEIFHGEAINYRKDGREFYLEWSIAPVRDERGEITHFVATQFDATARKQQEAQLRQRAEDLIRLNADLAQSNAELDAFAYVVSHDLKEPLRGIHNYAHFLHEDYAEQLTGEGAAMLQALSGLTDRMNILIDSLLQYARLGRQAISYQAVDLNQVLHEQLLLLAPRLQAHQVAVRIPTPLPVVQADAVLVAELFTNLITNAIKYNDKAEKWVEIGVVGQGDKGTGDKGTGDKGTGTPIISHPLTPSPCHLLRATTTALAFQPTSRKRFLLSSNGCMGVRSMGAAWAPG
ncbi:MAG: PAS domain S-box protein [Caldilineaceae bacterium]